MQDYVVAPVLDHLVCSQELEAEPELELGEVDGNETHPDDGLGRIPVSDLNQRLTREWRG